MPSIVHAADRTSPRHRRALATTAVTGLLAVAAGIYGYVRGDRLALWMALLLLLLGITTQLIAVRHRMIGRRTWLEVTAGRVTLFRHGRAVATELNRSDGEVLTVTHVGDEVALSVAGRANRDAALPLGDLDICEVRDAVLAHGWTWQARDDATVGIARAPSETDAPPVTELLLRDGHRHLLSAPAIGGTVAGAVVVSAAVVLAVIAGIDGPQPVPVYLAAVAVLGVVTGLCGFAMLLRLSRVVVTVDAERLSVRYGTTAAMTVDRSSAAGGRAGKRWLSLLDRRGQRLLRVPLRPRRDEVLTALRSYGWPCSDRYT